MRWNYYNLRQLSLLQSAMDSCYKLRQLFYYKVRHGILQIATGITKCDGFITKLRQYILCAKGTRAVPDKQTASAKELVVHVDNSMNNWSSNISKISVFGKGKYCFAGP